MRVKDIYPYIINRRVEITKNGKLLSILFQIDGRRVERPENSYHEIADCKVVYIYASISGMKIEVE